jgi:hypothetical protein
VNSERTILLTELETWALEDMIRHTWVDDGRPVGKGLLLKIFTLLDEFESRRGQPDPPRDLAVALTEDECWAIDFHIRRGHVDPSGVRIGRDLLMKVFRVLLELRNTEEVRLLGLLDAPGDMYDRDKRPRMQDLRDFLEQDGKHDEESGAPDDGSAEHRP